MQPVKFVTPLAKQRGGPPERKVAELDQSVN